MSAHFETVSCNNSARTQQIAMRVLTWFLISIQCTIGLFKLIFNLAPSIYTWFKPHGSHGLNPLGLRLMPDISEATRNWHVQHWFYHCKCNMASFECKNYFLTRTNRFPKKRIEPKRWFHLKPCQNLHFATCISDSIYTGIVSCTTVISSVAL